MDKIIKIIQVILQLLTGLIPLLEVFGKDDKSTEKVNNAIALLKDVKNSENNC